MWDIIQAAGWPIWFLIVSSVIALALIFERSRSLRTSLVLPKSAYPLAVQCLSNSDNAPELQQLNNQGSLGAVLAAGVGAVDLGQHAMRDAMDDALYYETHHLNRYLPAIGTIAGVAPLLGLFGTVIGMIETFGAQTPTGMNPAQLAHGISIALYNTAMGIFVAIVALLAYRILRSKAQTLTLSIEQSCAKLIDAASTKDQNV